MMIQSAPAGDPRFVCTMVQHNALCAQFMAAFGNDSFDRPEPYEQVAYVVGHHDRGWDGADEIVMLDPKSRFPRGIGTAGLPSGTGGGNTSTLSSEFNEKFHAYSGLLSSMHSWGLPNARYGFTEFRVRPGGSTSTPVRPGEEEAVQTMLDGEIARQERLKASLAADPETAPWVEEKRLMANYKVLQFFDTLALYFHLRHAGEHRQEVYVHVPKSVDDDTSITLRPLGDGRYSLDPFPFSGDTVETACGGRYFDPIPEGEEPEDMTAAFRALPETAQTYTLVPG
jgi:hypothetical protein